MNDSAGIARIGALVGDRARAEMLTALMGGEALTATELAGAAGITKQTASAHLTKMCDAGLLAVESQGRHRYFRIARRDVARLIEQLMGVADRLGGAPARALPRDPALRKARVCYDHLAGDLGVLVFDSLDQRRLLRSASGALALTDGGEQFCAGFGIEVAVLSDQRRPLCRACLDWTVRRHHLAGSLGAAVLRRCIDLGWARRVRGSRVMHFSALGEKALRDRFPLAWR
jgi:DNA-binding transcriptional ArsR family regulator